MEAKLIQNMDVGIEKMHFRGHKDDWCHQHCDPNSFNELEKVRMATAMKTKFIIHSY